MVTKAKCQKDHAIRKAKQRLGLCISTIDYDKLCDQIRDSKAKFLMKQSGRVGIWEVVYQNKKLTAIYDNSRHTIVTFLPKDTKPDQPVEWQPPKTLKELATRLQYPTCPTCGGVGRSVKWFSGPDWFDFGCCRCGIKWAEPRDVP